jgi:uncharacterized protein (UPF0332 family)
MMDPRQFLEVAAEWSVGTREAEWRSAASRAYYAAFHVASRLIQRAGFVVPGGERAHGYLWLRLSNSGHIDVDEAGCKLSDLRRIRNQADYDLGLQFPQDLAIDTVAVALQVIDLLETVETTPHILAQVTATMRVYERDVLRDVTWRP